MLRSALLVVLLQAACAGALPDPVNPAVEARNRAASADRDAELLVVTYNVHMETAERIARALRGSRLRGADIVFLQEIESHPGERGSRAARTAELLRMSHAYAPGRGLRSGGSHGVAILSRWPLSDLEVIELPRIDVGYRSVRRVALGATVEGSGGKLRLYNVHLDLRIHPRERRRQLEPVLASAERRPDMPTIVAGDMNTTPFCWLAHVAPVPCGRQDNAVEALVRERGFALPARRSGPTHKWFGQRLDALYTRGLTPRSVGVDRSVALSDHWPLWAAF